MAIDPSRTALTTVLTRRTALGGLATGAATARWTGPGTAQAHVATPTSGGAADQPDRFALVGGSTRIAYDALTAGGPRLAYQGPYGSRTVSGNELRMEDGALGHLVSASLGAFPDRGELRLTLLVPPFAPLASGSAPVPCATLAILAWTISTIAGPPKIGALESYEAIALSGTAARVGR